MEHRQAQENFSALVNAEALLGKLSGPRCSDQPDQTDGSRRPDSGPRLIPIDLKTWPREILHASLRAKIDGSATPLPVSLIDHIDIHRLASNATLGVPLDTAPFAKLNAMLEVLTNDIVTARERLLMLNPGRRKMIEHRLEFIARKIARARGERLNRSLSLPDILKESYRGTTPSHAGTPKLGTAAWRGFVAEVALYNLLELFFLKSLDVYAWRRFEPSDIGRMNYAAHTFLSQRAAGFAYDKHCWNFVRTNLYSWYVPSPKAVAALATSLDELATAQFAWSDLDLDAWISMLPDDQRPAHLDFVEDSCTAESVVNLIEKQLGVPLIVGFQGRPVCRRFFVPVLELGGVALALLDRMLKRVRQAAPNAYDGGIADESSQLHRAIWTCETESFEVFWAEVHALLKVLRTARSGNDFAATDAFGSDSPACLYRLPHAIHAVNSLALELHNLDQLALDSPDVSKNQQGSAAQIQQIESFDVAIVTDNPDRMKSAAWMRALAQQLPYWRSLVGTGTNLNWGELHLFLSLTKLKEDGTCVYLSHRALPESGDGERLRRAILGMATLDYLLELPEDACRPYRFLYVFRRVSRKPARDQHRPRFGQLASDALRAGSLDLSRFEEASSTQLEIIERGWDHIFVRGAAPLIRHLDHKFPKLFQFATIGDGQELQGARREGHDLFDGSDTRALEIMPDATSGGLRFRQLAGLPTRASLLIFPHNPVDLPWIQYLLSSAPAQFWIRQQLLVGKAPRLQELRLCPIVDLSRAQDDIVHGSLEWLAQAGYTKSPNADVDKLRAWACAPELTLNERSAKYVAIAKRCSQLERIVARYRPLFNGPGFEELRHDAIAQFYPPTLLCHISQSPDLRVQYIDRARASLLPENWTLDEIRSLVRNTDGKTAAYCAITTRQGPSINIAMPLPLRDYMVSQLRALMGRTWGEALGVLRIPRDIPLFMAQTQEITRVVSETARELDVYERLLEEMALDLFEVSADVRQFLPH